MYNHKEDNSKNKSLRRHLSTIKTIPVFLPTFIAALFIFLGILSRGGDLSIQSTFGDICLLLSLFLFSLTGVLAIIRREMPRLGLPSIKGWGAIVEGVLIIIITTVGMLLLLIDIIIK